MNLSTLPLDTYGCKPLIVAYRTVKGITFKLKLANISNSDTWAILTEGDSLIFDLTRYISELEIERLTIDSVFDMFCERIEETLNKRMI